MKLKYPFSHNGKTFDDVTPRRMRGGDMVTMERLKRDGTGDAEMSLALIELLCDLPDGAAAMMDAADIMSMSEVIENFLPEKARADLLQGQ